MSCLGYCGLVVYRWAVAGCEMDAVYTDKDPHRVRGLGFLCTLLLLSAVGHCERLISQAWKCSPA
jgi:hypothetical protein